MARVIIWKANTGRMPKNTQMAARKSCGTCMVQLTSNFVTLLARSWTNVLVRERKLVPKNFMKLASVSALVRTARTVQMLRYQAEELP